MWLKREGVKLVGICEWCRNGVQEDEPHHWHIFVLRNGTLPRGLYCEHCAVKAGWLPIPEHAKEVSQCQ